MKRNILHEIGSRNFLGNLVSRNPICGNHVSGGPIVLSDLVDMEFLNLKSQSLFSVWTHRQKNWTKNHRPDRFEKVEGSDFFNFLRLRPNWRLRCGYCGSFFLLLFFSCSQVVMKKSSNDAFFHSKRGVGWEDYHLSEIWQCFHSNNDVFT